MNILSDFSFVDVECSHNLYVIRSKTTDFAMHQPDGILKVFSFIKVDSLYQRTGTITNSDDGDSNFFHDAYDPWIL